MFRLRKLKHVASHGLCPQIETGLCREEERGYYY